MRCKHPLDYRMRFTPYSPIHADRFACDRCGYCGAWLPLGPANDDDPRVAVEIRAAELVSGGPTSERIDRIETPLEWLGRKGKTESTIVEPNPYYRPGMGRMLMRRDPVDTESAEWQAGYLAAAIANHDENRETE